MKRLSTLALVSVITLIMSVTPIQAELYVTDLEITAPTENYQNLKSKEMYSGALQLINREVESQVNFWNERPDVQKKEYHDKVKQANVQLARASYMEYRIISLDFLNWLNNFNKWAPPIPANGNGTIQDTYNLTQTQVFNVPYISKSIFTYMPIQAITSKTSAQYKFKQYQWADDRGYMRYSDAYGIALGAYYGTTIGTIYDIEFADGSIMKGVLMDCKANKDTDSTNQYSDSYYRFDGSVGNIVEFVMNGEHSEWINMEHNTKMNTINRRIANDHPTRVVSIKQIGHIGFNL